MLKLSLELRDSSSFVIVVALKLKKLKTRRSCLLDYHIKKIIVLAQYKLNVLAFDFVLNLMLDSAGVFIYFLDTCILLNYLLHQIKVRA